MIKKMTSSNTEMSVRLRLWIPLPPFLGQVLELGLGDLGVLAWAHEALGASSDLHTAVTELITLC